MLCVVAQRYAGQNSFKEDDCRFLASCEGAEHVSAQIPGAILCTVHARKLADVGSERFCLIHDVTFGHARSPC